MNVDTWITGRLDTEVPAVDGRIMPEIGDQESPKPYLVLKLITEEPEATHDKLLQATRHWHYSVCAIAETLAAARMIGEAAKLALVGFSGGGVQSVALQSGTRRSKDTNTGDWEYSFDISIWENLT